MPLVMLLYGRGECLQEGFHAPDEAGVVVVVGLGRRHLD